MQYKELASYFRQEMEAESVSTRKCLERIPESAYDFKPHEKSMELRYLALLVADIPKWVTMMIQDNVIDLAVYEQFKFTKTADLMAHYEENLKSAYKALDNITEKQAEAEFHLKQKGQVVYSSPMLKSIGETINHWVHHRGQLTVYLRLNDIAVPSIYGPSADERQF